MATAIKSPLSDAARKTTGEALQGAVVDLIDLSLQAKQAHWNLTGKHFRSLHLQLDDVVSSARMHTDTCAERAITIGVNPDGRPETISSQAKAPRVDSGYMQDDKVISEFIDILFSITGRFRERIGQTSDADPVTENILEDIVHDLEKHLWMFQAEK